MAIAVIITTSTSTVETRDCDYSGAVLLMLNTVQRSNGHCCIFVNYFYMHLWYNCFILHYFVGFYITAFICDYRFHIEVVHITFHFLLQAKIARLTFYQTNCSSSIVSIICYCWRSEAYYYNWCSASCVCVWQWVIEFIARRFLVL